MKLRVLSMNDVLIEFGSEGENKARNALQGMESKYKVVRNYEYKGTPYFVVEVEEAVSKKGK